MTPTPDTIRAAINAAEFAIKPSAHPSTFVSVPQETLLNLVFAANEHLSMNAKERIDKMECAISDAMEHLRGACR